MKIRICPLCDSEMTKKHKCDVCNSFIWHSQELDVHYNAGSRGRGEEDCAYGTYHDTQDHKIEKKLTKTQTQKRKKTTTKQASSYEELFGDTLKKDAKKKKKSSRGCITWIVGLIIGINVLGSLIGAVVGWLEDNDTISNIVDEWLQETDAEDVQYVSIDADDALIDYPDGCSRYMHFEMKADDIAPALEAWIIENYKDGEDIVDEHGMFGYNYEDTEEGTVILEINEYYYLGDDTYMDVNYDTVTSRIHYIYADYVDQDTLQSLSVCVLPLLEEGITEEEAEEEVTTWFEGDTLVWSDGLYGDVEIYIIDNDDGTYWIHYIVAP